MNRIKKYGIPALWGLGYAGVVVLLSRLLLRCLGDLLDSLGAGEQVAQAAGQLKEAILLSPWLMPVLIGGALGGALGLIKSRKVFCWVSGIAAVALLVPGVLGILCFTRINGICLLNLLRSFLPMLL